MEEIVNGYLTDTYEVNLKTYTTFKLFDKFLSSSIYMQDVFREVSEIFGLNEEEFDNIWTPWLRNTVLEFENKLTDIQYLIYEKTGLELNLQNKNWSDLIDEESEKCIQMLLNGSSQRV